MTTASTPTVDSSAEPQSAAVLSHPIERAPGARMASLDVFRGLTIAGMILVNNAGDWCHVYWPLEHAAWNGWTPTDLVFPFFVFIVGMTTAFSIASRSAQGAGRLTLMRHTLVRALVIFALGAALAALGTRHLADMRWPGVL